MTKQRLRQPLRWLERAKVRAQRTLPYTYDYPAYVWGFSTRRYLLATIEFLDRLDSISPDPKQDSRWWSWIIIATRLEATCKELGISKKERISGQEQV